MQDESRATKLDQIADSLYRLSQSETWEREDRAALIAAHDTIADLAHKLGGAPPDDAK